MLLKYGLPVLGAMALGWALMSVKQMTPVDAKVLPPSPPPVAAYPNQVGAVGLVEAASENISVSLPVPGLVAAVKVKAGDNVRKGQVLFTLDDRDLRAEWALRQSAAELSQTKLKRLEASPRPEEIPPAEARVREAQSLLGDAETQMRMMEAVKDKRAIRNEDLEKRRRAVETAQARVSEAQSQLGLLKAGAWRPDLEVARAEVAQAKQQVARLEADLGRLIVTAPIEGQILQCKVRPGEYAQAGVLAQAVPLRRRGVSLTASFPHSASGSRGWDWKERDRSTATWRSFMLDYPLYFPGFPPQRRAHSGRCSP